MPDYRLKRFGMGGYGLGVDRGDDHHMIADFCGIAAVAADNTENAGPDRAGMIQGGHKIGADGALKIAASHRHDEEGITGGETAGFQPRDKDAGPALVIGSSGQFRNIVGWSVGFNADDLAKIIDRVGTIGGTAAHS